MMVWFREVMVRLGLGWGVSTALVLMGILIGKMWARVDGFEGYNNTFEYRLGKEEGQVALLLESVKDADSRLDGQGERVIELNRAVQELEREIEDLRPLRERIAAIDALVEAFMERLP